MRKSILLFSILAALTACSCVKGSREVPLSPRKIAFEQNGGTIDVKARFPIEEIRVFDADMKPVGETVRMGRGETNLSGYQEFDYGWITISFMADDEVDGFTLEASPNTMGEPRKLTLGVYALDNMYSIAAITQK